MTKYVQEKVETMERPTTVWALVTIAILLVMAYGYFVNSAIVNIVATRSMQSKAAEITSSIGALEAEYFAMKSSLTMDEARSIGLSDPKARVAYVAKSSQSFSINR